MEIFWQKNTCSIESYIAYCLFDKKNGFYETEKIQDHFVTPLTMNSGFKQALASFLRQNTRQLMEIGPGHGQLARYLEPYLLTQSNSLLENMTLVEKSSEFYQKLQSDFAHNRHIQIKQELDKSFQGTVFLQEVLDCFPAQWFYYDDHQLYENVLTSNLKIQKQLITDRHDKLFEYLQFLFDQGVSENSSFDFLYSSRQTQFLKDLLSLKNSQLLIVDYGYLSVDLIAANQLVRCPLRAYRDHKQIEHFWSQAGKCDLTYDIDFSWVLQTSVQAGAHVEFYGALAEFLIKFIDLSSLDTSLLKPYLDPRQLGEVFKVALVTCADNL